MAFKKVLLIHPSKNMGAGFVIDVIPMGLEYLAAYIQKHVQKVDIIDLAKDPHTIEHYLNELKPDLVGISITYSIEHNESLEIAKKAKQAGASVVVGGYHATGLAEELASNPNIDFVVRGEGEETLLELVLKGSAEDIKGLSYFKANKVIHNTDRPLIANLEAISFPARNLRKTKYRLSGLGKEYDTIMTSRGCWGKCKFCCESMMCKGIQRYRKPEEVLKEVKEILHLHNNADVYIGIIDPNFSGNTKITEELCDKLIEFRSQSNCEFTFFACARVDVLGKNENLVKKMINAGIELINLGIETPNTTHLKLMQKKTTKELQERAVKNVLANGGKVYATFVVGLPYQTEKDIWECFEHAKRLKIDYLYFGIFTPLPGTKLHNEIVTNGLLIETDYDKYDFYNLVFKHEFLTAEQIRKIIFKATFNFYNDLTLQSELRESQIKKQKKKLYMFAIRFLAILNPWGPEDLLYIKDLKEFINPDLRNFTKKWGLHNIFEMTRFIKILGKQKIQITINHENEPILSWIIKTLANKVEYMDAIDGAENNATIQINFHIEDMSANRNLFDVCKKIGGKAFNDNRGVRGKFNLLRLFAAAGSEILAYKFNKISKMILKLRQ